jgi:hypothetical protein
MNGLGTAGVAPKVRLVNIRAGQDSGFFFLQATVDAMVYAGLVGEEQLEQQTARAATRILTRTAKQTPCPSPPNFAYPHDRDPSFEGVWGRWPLTASTAGGSSTP